MNIFLFHRDLRLQDNTSLIQQIKQEKTITPIFIFPPEQINKTKNKYFNNNSVQFMIESLHDLYNSISKYNGKLYFFNDDTLTVLKNIHKITKINSIAFNFDYTPFALKRDNSIKKWCSDNNIKCIIHEDYLLYDILTGSTLKKDNTPYKVYTPFKNYCLKNLKVRPINKFNKFIFTKNTNLHNIKGYLTIKEINKFYTNNEYINVHGGRVNALKILKNIKNFKNYNNCRDMLNYNTTYLGAHNHFTTVSIREVYYKIFNELGKNNDLINELHWRDYYSNIVYYFPDTLGKQIGKKNLSFKSKMDKLKWKNNNTLVEKWKKSQLGIPICDAAMRQLLITGHQHNRARMITSCVLTKLLLCDWRIGEYYFATKLVDYSPIQNNCGWQWQIGGIDPQQVSRIFSPELQSIKFDKDCKYIKKWLPELKNVPNEHIHNWSEYHKEYLKNGIKYYPPAFDYSKARKYFLDVYKKI